MGSALALSLVWGLGEVEGDWGRESCCWRARGASIMVAIRPEETCHSMWQWKSQMPIFFWIGFSGLVFLGGFGGGGLSEGGALDM